MSRTPFFSRSSLQGHTYRPRLDVLEDRLAPGSLLGTLEPPFTDLGSSLTASPSDVPDLVGPSETRLLPFTDLGSSLAAKQQDASDLALLVGAATSQPAETPPLSPEAAPPINSELLSSARSTSSGRVQASTPTTNLVVDFATRSIVFGESTLTRTDDSITIHLTASDLPAGVYSGWIPIFNPGGTVPVAAGRVAGHVVGEGGQLTFSVHLKEGEIISGHPVFPSGSLQDAQLQDIGMVVRYHGPADPGRIHEQTNTYELDRAIDFLFTIHRVS